MVAYDPTIDDLSLDRRHRFLQWHTSVFIRLSVRLKESTLLVHYGASRLSVSHTPSVCPSPSRLTISRSSWSPASSPTTPPPLYMGLACRCISILLHLEGICLYMWACACVRTCATMFHLIEAPCWHPGQIDQLVCQLSWQISPSVSLFLKPTPLSLFLFFLFSPALSFLV